WFSPVRCASYHESSVEESAVEDVLETAQVKIAHVLIQEGVKHLAAGFARPHQTQLAQHPQLVRDGRLAQLDRLGQRAHALLSGYHGGDQAHTRGIAEGTKELRDICCCLLIDNLD